MRCPRFPVSPSPVSPGEGRGGGIFNLALRFTASRVTTSRSLSRLYARRCRWRRQLADRRGWERECLRRRYLVEIQSELPNRRRFVRLEDRETDLPSSDLREAIDLPLADRGAMREQTPVAVH